MAYIGNGQEVAFTLLLVLLGLSSVSFATTPLHSPDFGALGVQRTVPLVPSAKGFPFVFTSLPREYENVILSTTVGEVPPWIEGDFLKTGFCGYEQPTENGEDPEWKFTMLFDALGCGYRLSFRDGQVRWWAKHTMTKYREASIPGPPRFRIFQNVEPEPSYYEKIRTYFQFDNSDNLNVNMVLMSSSDRDHVVAISDVEGEMEFDMETMETKGQIPWDDEISRDSRNVVNTCAHPSKIADDPALYNYLKRLDVGPHLEGGMAMSYQFYKVDPTERAVDGRPKRTVVGEIPINKDHYVHHFSQTPNYIIVVEMPFFWSIPAILTGTTIKPALYFDPSEGVNVKVIRTATGELEKEYFMPDESFFCFHHINSFEDSNGDVHVDLATYDDIGYHIDSFQLHGHHANNTHDLPPGTFRRVRLPLESGGDASVTKIGTVDMELPIVNMNVRGRPYRYVFAHSKSKSNRAEGCKSGPGCGGTWWDSIVKVDTETGEHVEWRRDDHWPSEPAFVPRPGATAEDDGVLLDVVTWGGEGGEGGAYLVILDARTMEAIAEVPLPSHVPYQSHGNWFPSKAAARSSPGFHVQRGNGPVGRGEGDAATCDE